jgi:DNA-binding transcriptional ArsR family regulator
MKRDVFQGIADPTRRQILGMISQRSLNVNTIASNFEVSRTAIYKHMKILSECGLLIVKQQGRERYCEARVKKLNEVLHWVDQYKKISESRFDSLNGYLRTGKKKNSSKKKVAGKSRM